MQIIPTSKGGFHMALLEISIIPIGTDSSSIGNIISQSCSIIKNRDLDYKITPTSTIIEGELDDLINIAKDMHSFPFNKGVDRVITSIRIDQRIDKPSDMDSMVEETLDKM